jgi:MFS family permease
VRVYGDTATLANPPTATILFRMPTHPPTAAPTERQGFAHLLRALRHRNYRLFITGQSFSLIGTWMQSIALNWLIYRLTGSAFLLGVVGFTNQIPVTIFAPLAGVFADRWNLHRTIIITQSLALIQAFLLAALVFSGTIQVWQIITLSLMLGFINAFDTPSRQSFIVHMVDDKRDLSNAIALNSSMVNAARLIGPSIAGVLIAWVGEGVCFLVNGFSYMAVIIALLAMRIVPKPNAGNGGNVMGNLKEGLRYAFATPPIRSLLLLMAAISIIGLPYPSLLPIFAKDILQGGPRTLGFLMGATGVGALCGAIYLASRRSVIGLDRVLSLAAGLLGIGLIFFSLSRVFWLSLGMMFFIGLGMMTQVASTNTLLQTIVDDDKRGRVISLFILSFMGMVPLGTLIAGSIASAIGAPLTLAINGAVCIVACLIFIIQLPKWRKQVHPIYVAKGILSRTSQ